MAGCLPRQLGPRRPRRCLSGLCPARPQLIRSPGWSGDDGRASAARSRAAPRSGALDIGEVPAANSRHGTRHIGWMLTLTAQRRFVLDVGSDQAGRSRCAGIQASTMVDWSDSSSAYTTRASHPVADRRHSTTSPGSGSDGASGVHTQQWRCRGLPTYAVLSSAGLSGVASVGMEPLALALRSARLGPRRLLMPPLAMTPACHNSN